MRTPYKRLFGTHMAQVCNITTLLKDAPTTSQATPGPPKSAEVSAFLRLAAFLVSLAAFFSKSSSVQNRQQEIAEFGGKSAEFGGKSAEFRGSRFQHVGVFVAFFGLFGGNFCRRGLSAESSAAGTPCFLKRLPVPRVL